MVLPQKVLPLGEGGEPESFQCSAVHIREKKNKKKGCKQESTTEEGMALLGGKDGTDFHGARARGHTGNKGYGVRFPFRLVTSFTRCFWDGKTHIEKCRHLKFDNCLKF